jgi:adenylate cyclase
VRHLFEDYVSDTDRRELCRGTDTVSVAPQVFDLLDYLIRNRERVVSKDDLIAAIWGGRIVSDAALTTRLNVAGATIGDSGEEQRLIKTLPRKGIRFVGAVREEPLVPPTAVTASWVGPPKTMLALPDKPSVAVLPFANMSGETGQEYFADGITDDIITELSRFSELFVIARNSSFQYKGKSPDIRQVGRELGVRYVLEGSFRRVGHRVRITAELIDAATGAHRWAERYDRELKDIFAVQDEVARTIVAILAAHVNRAEVERALLKGPTTWQAYDYYIRAADVFASFWASANAQDIYEARRLLEHSLAIDPNYARAYAVLSSTFVASAASSLDDDYLSMAVLDKAHQLARKAVQLDANLPQAHAALGRVLTWKAQHQASIAEFEKASALNPNLTDWRFASALICAGDAARALTVAQAHLRLDPFYPPQGPLYVGMALYMLKRYSDAVQPLRECVSRAPDMRGGHSWLAATHAQLGQLKEARAEAAEVLRIEPNFTVLGQPISRLGLFERLEDAEHFFAGLRKAGLPER